MLAKIARATRQVKQKLVWLTKKERFKEFIPYNLHSMKNSKPFKEKHHLYYFTALNVFLNIQ